MEWQFLNSLRASDTPICLATVVIRSGNGLWPAHVGRKAVPIALGSDLTSRWSGRLFSAAERARAELWGEADLGCGPHPAPPGVVTSERKAFLSPAVTWARVVQGASGKDAREPSSVTTQTYENEAYQLNELR